MSAPASATGRWSAFWRCAESDDVMLSTAGGMVNRTHVSEIRIVGHACTQGVRVMNLREGDKIASLAKVARGDVGRSGQWAGCGTGRWGWGRGLRLPGPFARFSGLFSREPPASAFAPAEDPWVLRDPRIRPAPGWP